MLCGRCWVGKLEWKVWSDRLLVESGVVWRRLIVMCCLVCVWLPVVWSYLCWVALIVVAVLGGAVYCVRECGGCLGRPCLRPSRLRVDDALGAELLLRGCPV